MKQDDFFNSVDKQPDAALFILCYLFTDASVEAKFIISTIAAKISTMQLEKIIECMLHIEKHERPLQDKELLLSFSIFKVALISRKIWFKHLGLDRISQFTQNDEFMLMGLIALTRKHHILLSHTDPFEGFDFGILQKAGVEQLIDIIGKFVQPCESLPLKYFKKIGKKDIEHARIILFFLQEHSSRFKMGEFFLKHHPELKEELNLNWEQTKESTVLTKASASSLEASAISVSHTYPEFNSVIETTRTKKDNPDDNYHEHNHGYLYNMMGHFNAQGWQHVLPRIIAFGSVLTEYTKATITGRALAPWLAAAEGSPTLPAFLCMGGGISYLYRSYPL